MEHIFPFLGIRFKSINDHYDSAKHEGKTIGMDVAFKNLIYDYYSKDLSQKVKSAMRTKQQKARFVNTVPYGYKTHQDDKHQLVIDGRTAPVVRRIFLNVIDGKSCTQIAKELNAEGILTPAQAKAIHSSSAKKPQWTHRAILSMIENIKYTGVMANHMRESRFIREGDPLEIYTSRDGEVIFKKYSLMGGLDDFAAQLCETMSRSTGAICAVTDRDSVIAVAGGAKRELLGKGITAQLEQVMENRRIYQYDGQGPQIPVSDSSDRLMAIVAAPILSEGDLLGLVLFISDSPAVAGDAEYKLAQTVAAFLGRHMEN